MQVAILTDFGYQDPYVGIMKAVMMDFDPSIRFIDLSHGISPFDLRSAGYVLLSAWRYLPRDTTVLAVVDPGVGSSRREIIASGDGKAIVAPDNGLVSLVDLHAGPLAYHRARDGLLAQLAKLRPPFAHTFDGRDLFAPVAARIASSGVGGVIGERVEPVRLSDLHATRVGEGAGPAIHGNVVHIDTFGNVVTTITEGDLAEATGDRTRADRTMTDPTAAEPLRVEMAGQTGVVTAAVARTFADAPRGEAIAYVGSAGFLEVAIREGNLASTYGIVQAASVRLG